MAIASGNDFGDLLQIVEQRGNSCSIATERVIAPDMKLDDVPRS